MTKAQTKTRRWTAADDRLAVAWTMTLDDLAFALERTDREILERLRELEVLPARQPGGGEGESGGGGEAEELPLSPSPTLPLDANLRIAGLGEEPARGAEAMDADQAEAVARRVLLHLYRGSIDAAREALEDGWREHARQFEPLPLGAELLEEPLSRVLDDVRLCNFLEGGGILTIGDLLAAGEADLLAIPNLGHSALAKLRQESLRLRQRAGLPPRDDPPPKAKKSRGLDVDGSTLRLCASA